MRLRCYFRLETGELPFAPELNVDIAAYEQFKQFRRSLFARLGTATTAGDMKIICLITCLDEPIKSPQYRDSALSG